MSASNQSSQARDIVYCHQCRNEWYRDEHGLVCPECHSDFTEIIEPLHDPRLHETAEVATQPHRYETADDPEEEDVGNIGWRHDASVVRGNIFNAGEHGQADPAAHQQELSGPSGSLFGFIGSMLPNLLGGAQRVEPQFLQDNNFQHRDGNFQTGEDPDRASDGQSNGQASRIRHFHGPGYNITVATSSSSNLFPRDAHNSQPFEHQPHNLEQVMHQMLSNIGVTSSAQMGPSSGSSANTGRDASPQGFPFSSIFQLLGVPFGLAESHGDAVFSQEALDRVITELMEQNQSGNAPGPASAEAIEALPKRRIEPKDLDGHGRADCSICMDTADIETVVTELPCHHWFHTDCIKAWLIEHDTCPHCRQSIMSKDSSTND